jgi:hypothetical protein
LMIGKWIIVFVAAGGITLPPVTVVLAQPGS